MIKKQLASDIVESLEKVPNIERRFTLQGLVIIVIVLAAVIVFLFRDSNKVRKQTYDDVVIENRELKGLLRRKNNQYDSLKDSKYYELYMQSTKFLLYKDSMNYELQNIRKSLTSK